MPEVTRGPVPHKTHPSLLLVSVTFPRLKLRNSVRDQRKKSIGQLDATQHLECCFLNLFYLHHQLTVHAHREKNSIFGAIRGKIDAKPFLQAVIDAICGTVIYLSGLTKEFVVSQLSIAKYFSIFKYFQDKNPSRKSFSIHFSLCGRARLSGFL